MLKPILLVEDSPNDIELALYALKRCGVHNKIDVVRDGEEALEYLLESGRYAGRRGGAPQLVLLDLKLPAIDGITVLCTIRSTPKLSALPVVVITASDLETDRKRSLELGIESYVVKPIGLKAFVEQICRLAATIRH